MVFAVFFPFVAAIVVWMLGRNSVVYENASSDKKVMNIPAYIMIIISACEIIALMFMFFNHYINMAMLSKLSIGGVGGMSLNFCFTGFRAVFAILTAIAWFITFLFSKEYMENDVNVIRYDFYNLATLGATMAIFFAADFFTLFFFFEIMSFTSFVWVAHRQTGEAEYAAGTYLGIAVAGGLAILMGLFLVYSTLGTLMFGEISTQAYNYIYSSKQSPVMLFVAAGCMFAGFGAKASAFPVHVWLPQSYTEAPAPATALLSAILSKTGVFGILLVTMEVLPADENWAMFILIIGVVTMVLGGIKGVLCDNLKTTIAYSSMSQIGFILVGVGMQGLLNHLMYSHIINKASADTEEINEAFNLAVNGTLLHMVNHSIVKLILFMIAGVVFMNVGSYELNKVRGFGRKKIFIMVSFLLAAAGVGGVPLLNGYISKTLLHESIVEYTKLIGEFEIPMTAFTPDLLKVIEYLFLFSGGLTIAYMTKLFVVLFVEKNADEKVQAEYNLQKRYISQSSKIAIGLCAAVIPFIGILPHLTADNIARYGYDIVPLYMKYIEKTVHYFSITNLSGAMISIIAGAIVYFILVRVWMLRKTEMGYVDPFPKWMNMEKYVYRALFYKAVPFILGIISRILDSIVDTIVVILRKTVYSDRALPYELPEGNYVIHKLGITMERINMLYCVLAKKEYKPKNYEHRMALKNTEIFEDAKIIERSLSFGLFMFCLGLALTMIYLLMVN